VPILWGLPTSEAFEAADRGTVVLGGCVVESDPDNWECTENPEHEWGTERFERAWQAAIDEALRAPT
jgi:hypothetical protein